MSNGRFGEGFATGFFNKLSEGIDTRNEDARNYFNKQVETARTLGLENRRRSSAVIDESVNVAKRLQAMGVPKDIIMAQANMDPAGLGDFYSQVEKLRLEANVPVNEEFFRSVYKLSGTFQAPDEDFNTFFSKIYGPIVSAAKEDPEGFKQDPEGSIWAKAFGIGAMDRARDKLATTEVVPGMTAEQAIAQGDTPRPNKVGGDSFVTVDTEALRKAAGDTTKSLTPQVMEAIRTDFEEQATLSETTLTSETDEAGNPLFDTADPASNELLVASAKKQAYDKIKEQYVGNEDYLTYIRSRYNLDEDGMPIGAEEPQPEPTEGITEAPIPETTTGSPNEGAPVEATTEPVEATEESGAIPDITTVDGSGNTITLTFVSNNMDGTATYKNQATGKLLTYPVEEFNALANR